MEYPFGKHHHNHHHRNEGEDEVERYPPPSQPPPRFADPLPPPPSPPNYGEEAPPPPLIDANHTSYNTRDFDFPAPPPPHRAYPSAPPFADTPPPSYYREEGPPPPVIHANHISYNTTDFDLPVPPPHPTAPPPPYASVHHVSHDTADPVPYDSEVKPHDHFRPHMPSFVHHHIHSHTHNLPPDLLNKPTFRVFCKAKTEYSLTIGNGKVILARSDHRDDLQRWIKDEKFSTRVKDKQGFPSFALVNKTTGQAMKHSVGESHPVQLIPYNPDVLDESILWTESKELGDGFRTIRMINNIQLNLDACHGDKSQGGVYDGTVIVLEGWKKGDNQRWKIIPY